MFFQDINKGKKGNALRGRNLKVHMETQDFRMAKWFSFTALGSFHAKGNPMKFLSSRKFWMG